MIKCAMYYIDILFPIRLSRLTYSCPADLEGKIIPGQIVSAPLKKGLARGIVIDTGVSPSEVTIREMSEIIDPEPVAGKGLLKLISWASDYYLVTEGLVLKHFLPKELLNPQKRRASRAKDELPVVPVIPDIPEDDVSEAVNSAISAKYAGFLLHAPSRQYEYAFASRILTLLKNVIILVPETNQADYLHAALQIVHGERICILHGDMSEGSRTDVFRSISSGKCDVVIGTRGALFAPIRKLSLVLVLNEESTHYKLEEGIRCNLRDIAVKRAHMEKATVVLSSLAPSIDSYFNALSGKYHLIYRSQEAERPKIRIVNMKYSKSSDPIISKTVYDEAGRQLRQNRKIMLILNRRGHSSMLTCRDCGRTEVCENCSVPLVYHKNKNLLVCHYCGSRKEVPEQCKVCRSPHIELLGMGTENLEEMIAAQLKSKPLRFDSDTAQKKSEIRELSESASRDEAHILLGTKLMTGNINPLQQFSLVAVLNIDSSLNIPDFRASEKTWQELASYLQFVGPGGLFLVQTRHTDAALFRFFKSGDYRSFVNEELTLRKELNYPPYARMANVLWQGRLETANKIAIFIKKLGFDLEILGPVSIRLGKKNVFSLTLKARERKTLHIVIRQVIGKFEKEKGILRTDIDPF